jgi:hypothetical protein
MSLDTVAKQGPGSIELPRTSSPVVKSNSLLFAHFERPSLEAAENYLRDFGLVRAAKTERQLFMRGTGPCPYIYRVTLGQKARFLGLGLSVPRGSGTLVARVRGSGHAGRWARRRLSCALARSRGACG